MRAMPPCGPNCVHKPPEIQTEGCGPYHDKCQVFKKWQEEEAVRKKRLHDKKLLSSYKGITKKRRP